jgi:hypothetical protein
MAKAVSVESTPDSETSRLWRQAASTTQAVTSYSAGAAVWLIDGLAVVVGPDVTLEVAVTGLSVKISLIAFTAVLMGTNVAICDCTDTISIVGSCSGG